MEDDLNSDYKRICAILVALVSNSLKFTRKGKIRVSINQLVNESGRVIHFQVADTGQGMSKNDLKLLKKKLRIK